MQNKRLLTITTAALFIAIGVLMPSFFHAIGLGVTFSPMHIPVLLCGMICGWFLGLIAGLLVPLISSFLTGMPHIFPMCATMMCELATYGAISGLLISILKGTKFKNFAIIVSVIISMLLGRIVYGIVGSVFFLIAGNPMSFSIYITAVLLSSWPGIVLQIVLIPTIIYLFDKLNILEKYGFSFKQRARELKND